MNHVVLKNLQFSSSGSYRCEVSTEAPTFETVYLTHNITVLGKDKWKYSKAIISGKVSLVLLTL